MYGTIQRDDRYLGRLAAFMAQNYGIVPLRICAAKRGFYGETWKVQGADRAYFVKLVYAQTHKQTYQNSFDLAAYLTDCKLGFIPALICSKSGERFTVFDGAVMGVFEWVDGENIQNEATKKAEYRMLARIYALTRPDMPLAREDFDGQGFVELSGRLKALDDAGLNALFERLDGRIRRRAERLALFSRRCRADTTHFYITHGDAGGNIVCSGDAFYLVDWDIPKLAPPERDAWFCMGWPWATALFEQSLADAGVDYRLNPDRLAYYAYFYYFYYLNEYLKAYQALPEGREALLSQIEQFCVGWIEESFVCAEQIQ